MSTPELQTPPQASATASMSDEPGRHIEIEDKPDAVADQGYLGTIHAFHDRQYASVYGEREIVCADGPNETVSFQVAYVAARDRLSPCLARLICELANIAGRWS